MSTNFFVHCLKKFEQGPKKLVVGSTILLIKQLKFVGQLFKYFLGKLKILVTNCGKQNFLITQIQLHKNFNLVTIMWRPNSFSIVTHGDSSSVMKSFHALILTNVIKKSGRRLTWHLTQNGYVTSILTILDYMLT